MPLTPLMPRTRPLRPGRRRPQARPAAPGWHLRSGVDLAAIDAITDAVTHWGERYLKRVYTPAEIAYALGSDVWRDQRLAARFAAKEAAIKALGLGHAGVAWTAIEVTRAASGEPQLRLHGTAAAAAQRLGLRSCSLSLSHDGGYALAMVTLLCSAPDLPFNLQPQQPDLIS